MIQELPIGIFDSGIGGLTVLKAVVERLPGEAVHYLGDTARLPYGTKSAQAVHHYALAAAGALAGRGIKALVVADNTSSAHALEALRAEFPGLPVIGVVEPGVDAAVSASRTGRIAVLSTESTAEAGTYPRAIAARRPDAETHPLPCPLLVALAEEGLVDDPIAERVARHYLMPLLERPNRPDCLLLGCTHLPPFIPLLRRILPPGIAIIDSATTTAAAVADVLGRLNLLGPAGRRPPPPRYLVTDGPERFARVARVFVPWRIDPAGIELVDIG